MTTTLAIEATPPPLAANEQGVILVGGTRVTLDTVVYAFKQGATAEEIVEQYPSLSLKHTYSTISFYLDHSNAVEEYLKERAEIRESVQHQNEARFDPNGIRYRLTARR